MPEVCVEPHCALSFITIYYELFIIKLNLYFPRPKVYVDDEKQPIKQRI